jgi:hypothetical protein
VKQLGQLGAVLMTVAVTVEGLQGQGHQGRSRVLLHRMALQKPWPGLWILTQAAATPTIRRGRQGWSKLLGPAAQSLMARQSSLLQLLARGKRGGARKARRVVQRQPQQQEEAQGQADPARPQLPLQLCGIRTQGGGSAPKEARGAPVVSEVSHNGWPQLMEALTQLRGLRYLTLHGCGGALAPDAIPAMLAAHPGLQEVRQMDI